MHVSYSVDLRDRHAHLYSLEARFPTGGDFVELKLPVWTPGSYLIREYQRHLQDLSCDDGEGLLLPVEKIDKATWRVDARQAQALFGGVPYDDYTFLLLCAPNAFGGLEHMRSCTLLASPFTFAPRKKYEEFLELASHEFFHLWNVKRIHPRPLGPFDYQREA